ncbi:MAG: hypothetical protein QM496_09020 [Verrucomicrobiota bacterium]
MIEYNVSEQTEIPEANGFSVKIIGVGGSGANVLDRMALEGSEAGDLLTINTDVRALSTSVSSNKIQLGKELLMGMGAGGDPELGREASLEAEGEIRDAVRGYSMVFVCVGLGGGTGSGAAPEVCRIAREEGAFLVAFTSLPFGFEGKRRMEQATDALKGIGEYANAVVTFENDRMGELLVAKEGIQQAFAAADKLISQSILATTNMVTQPGIIRLGMDDLLTALRNRDSRCLFGFGLAKGDNRAQEALAQALKSPLIDKTYLMDSAENVLIHISGGDSLTLYEVEILMGELAKHVSDQAQILFGVGTDKKLGNSLAVTLISSVSSEKIGPSGSRRKKEEDKKKALTKDDSGSDDDGGDDDGGGGGSAKPGKSSAKVETKGSAGAAPPPPDDLELNAEPGAELQVEDDTDGAEELTDSGVSEEIEKTETVVGDDEESAEISSAATAEAADEISAEEEVAEEEVAEEEVAEEEVAEEEEPGQDEEEIDEIDPEPELEQEVSADQESFNDANDEQEDEIIAEEAEEVVEEEEVESGVELKVDAEDLPSGLEEEISEIEAELKSINQQIEEFDEAEESAAETIVESAQDLDDEPEAAAPEPEPETDPVDEVEAPDLIEEESEDSVSAIEEIDEVEEEPAVDEVPEEAVPGQGMASLLGLTPVNVDEGSDEVALPTDEPLDEQEDLEPEVEADVEPEEAAAEVSPFEIDDEEEDDEGAAEVAEELAVSIEKEQQVDEPEEEVPAQQEQKKPSLPMSIRDLAKKSMQDQQAGQAEDELIVHALDEVDGDDEADEDEEASIFDVGDEEEGDEEKVNVADVILSAAAGDDGDQEITLSRVDAPEDEDDDEEELEEELADSAEEQTDEDISQSDPEDFPDLGKGESGDEKPGKSGPRKQGVLELEPTAKGRFAKTDPTIVEGQDLDVPTFLRARRD